MREVDLVQDHDEVVVSLVSCGCLGFVRNIFVQEDCVFEFSIKVQTHLLTGYGTCESL